ncbi:zinc-dependent alcohol dehydrogenase [Aquabacter spiritensis]|uniref:Threonine dehydrogenase-like Zn-dependent dehydrogenase n=1 Tax=Aquabacter spiritensis TaxID=933073 RepID=A0A4R3M2T8_9HYPH|nr:zinc-binding alcohol dehydrogenase [Aquabacter spiritensis]TCT07521.1 threonine dehydrogenase-like Zn-dependent dehydrogenase [Aquabacter spiritensis]
MNMNAVAKRHADVSPQDGRARALWYVGPRTARIAAEDLPAPKPGEICVRAAYSGISRGTERLVFAGLTDPAHRDSMRSPMQVGDFPFPVKYGYCSVGRVEVGAADLVGRDVFVLHPHQDRFVIAAADAILLPDGVPARRATLAANMETALNALWDSGAGAGDRIIVVGAGLVGLLITYLAARLPGAEVTAVDPNPTRQALVEGFGARYASEVAGLADADVVFHASATSDGLQAAIESCGTEACLVEVSWYGDEAVTIGLGGPFHCRRLRLVSSQVGSVAPARRPRWSHRRRLAKAIELLSDPRLDAVITGDVAFADLPEAIDRILDGGSADVATVVRYPA